MTIPATNAPKQPSQTSECRRRFLDDPRIPALAGVMGHILGFSAKEIADLLGVNAGLIKLILRDMVTDHQRMLKTPAGIVAIELRKQFVAPAA